MSAVAIEAVRALIGMGVIEGIPDRALRADQVCELIGMGKTWLYAEIARGNFPAPFKPSERASLWLLSEVLGWLRERAASRRGVGKAVGSEAPAP